MSRMPRLAFNEPQRCSGAGIGVVWFGNGRRIGAKVWRWPPWRTNTRNAVIVTRRTMDDRAVVSELDCAGRVSVRLCSELPFEAEQLRERHLRGDHFLARFVRPCLNLAPPHRKALEDGLNVPVVRSYDDLHDWLQYQWLGLLRRLLEGQSSSRS